MIAVDWSHTKNLTTYDGKKIRIEDRKSLIERLKASIVGKNPNIDLKPERSGHSTSTEETVGGESKLNMQSTPTIHPPTIILEEGCPLSLIYSLLKAGALVRLISNRATEDYRQKHGIKKSDENDARIIYELAQKGGELTTITLDEDLLKLHDLYHQYCRYQKARVAMMNMRKGHLRQYGECDMLPYDIGIDTMEAKEKGLLKELEKLVPEVPQTLHIKGLGKRIWAGIFVTANPAYFKCLSAYLRFCGLVNPDSLNNKYNRHTRMLYHMLADQIVRQDDPEFRPLYDKIKADIAKKYVDYTKLHIHNAALNRTATFLAKAIYKHSHMKPM